MEEFRVEEPKIRKPVLMFHILKIIELHSVDSLRCGAACAGASLDPHSTLGIVWYSLVLYGIVWYGCMLWCYGIV